MAERRMFAKTIVLSDAFLDMPMSARNLYFTLGMVADDDGFVNNPRSIMRQISATDDDMKVLIAKKFVLIFDNGVIVIKHWRINNYLRSDRYKDTKYLEERAHLTVDDNGAYHLDTAQKDAGIPPVYQAVDERYTQDRIGKVSIGEGRLEQESIGKDKENNNPIFLSEKAAKDSTEDPNHEAQIAYWRKRLDLFRRQGFDTDGVYSMAEADGVSREEIDSYIPKEEIS